MNQNLAEIRWTDNYEQFKRINYNRDVMESRVSELVESINKYGYLLPILVNQDLMIVDGQHRIEAAKKSGHKVSYIQIDFEENMLPILIATVNSTSKNWRDTDYLNMWVSIGKEAYLYIANMIDENCINIETFLTLTGFGKKGKIKFYSGNIKFSEQQKETIHSKLEKINQLRNVSDSCESFKNSIAFTRATMKCIKHPDYNHDRMVTQLEKSPGSLVVCNNTKEYVRSLEIIYNRGLGRGKGNRISFEIDSQKK